MPISVDEAKKKEQDYEKDFKGWTKKVVNFLKENKDKAFTFDEIIEKTGAPLDSRLITDSRIGRIHVGERVYWYYEDSTEQLKEKLKRVLGVR